MADNKENDTIVDIGNQSKDQESGNSKDTPPTGDLKQQAGDLLKAAGAFGKLAFEKGNKLKERIDKEELPEKAASGFRSISSKATHSASKIVSKTTGKKEESKQTVNESYAKDNEFNSKNEEDTLKKSLVEPNGEKPVSTEPDKVEKNKNTYKIQGASVEEGKPMMDAIKDEFKERRKENKKIHAAVKAEEERLARKRKEAKKSVVRKIKAIDDFSTKREAQRDEKKLAEFQEKEVAKIAEARSERRKRIVSQNKKTIGITAAIIVVIIMAVIGGIIIAGKARIADNYNKGIECIVAEDYESAVSIFAEIDYKDSKSLEKYAGYQVKIDEYKGKSSDLLEIIKKIEDIENEEVKAQHDEAVSQLTIAKNVQTEIDNINLNSLEAIGSVDFNTISKELSSLSERYKPIIETKKYDVAYKLSENLKHNTEVAKLINDISAIEDVTLDSEDVLKSLRKRYDSLSTDDKALIINLSELAAAETKFRDLKAAKEEEERIKKEEEKKAALQAEAEASAAESRDRITVYVTGTRKYHLDGCGDLARAGWSRAITYGEAKSRYSPCLHCNPDTFCERTFKTEVNDYIEEHSND